MIAISDPWMPLLLSALRDAVEYNQGLLRSETLRNRADYEEHLLHFSELFSYVKAECERQQRPGALTVDQILGHPQR